MTPLRRPPSEVAESQVILEDLVTQLGLARMVALLAEIATRRADIVRVSGDDLKAAVWMHDVRILERAAQALDGD
jgi:hypothetical protein